MAGLTDRPEVSRLEVVDTGRRRRWTEEEKLRIVTESLSGPRLGSVTARRYGIGRSLLATWRRQFDVRAAGGSRFVPAVVVPERPTGSPPSSRLEIVASNRRRGGVDARVGRAAVAPGLELV